MRMTIVIPIVAVRGKKELCPLSPAIVQKSVSPSFLTAALAKPKRSSCRIIAALRAAMTTRNVLGRVIPLRFWLLPPTLPVLAGRAGGQVDLPSASDW